MISFETSSEVKMKIFILKLWYLVCAIFCVFSLNTLVKERYEVAILVGDPSKVDPVIILACQKLDSLKIEKTTILLEELRSDFFHYFNRSKYPSLWGEDSNIHKKKVLNRLETGQYYILNGLFCIHSKDEWEASSICPIQSKPVFLAFKKSTLDFAQKTNDLSDSFDLLSVQKKGPPYSNCSESNERFRCLNECFKEKFRLVRYFYEGNETGPIHLKPETNETLENEKSCFEKCWRENCEILQFIPKSEVRSSRTSAFEARPKQSEFEFWVQFIGLVCSFANVSFNQLVSMTTKFTISKVKRRRVRIGLFCLKWAILFLTLIYCGYLYTSMVQKHQAKEKTPSRKEITRNHIKQKVVRFAICVKINSYLTRDYFLNINRLNKTMSAIEKTTDRALDDHLEGIHLNYQGRKFRVNYILEPKALFTKSWDGLKRCFILRILPDYQLMSSNPKFTIKFKNNDHKLYLLTKKESLSEKSLEYKPKKRFMKRVVKRLKQSGKCVNYRERYENCTSRLHCLDSCINRKALEKFEKILIDKGVVDKDQFSPREWGTTYPMEIPSYGPNSTIHKNLNDECKKKFQDKPPCVEVTFKETLEIISPGLNTIEIDLFLDVQLSIEELSWFKLLLDILNIQSIFFGMTVLKLLKMLYRFLKPNFRMKNEKIVQCLIYLLCSLGFTYHTYRIFEMSINGELTYTPDYEIVNKVQMPVMMFCLPVNEKLIDRNHQLTGYYLEQQTSHMTAENMFKSITYLDETNEWIPFNFSLMERFFFLHFKCFRITIDREYNRMHYHFSKSSLALKVLKANFNHKFINSEKGKTVFFMTKTNETTGFSNIANLVYDFSSTRYSAEQSELTVTYEDRFSFIKRLLSTHYEDEFSDLDGELPEQKSSRFSFRTLKVPVEEEDFDFELGDDLFDQLFTRIKTETTSNLLNNLDYQQTLVFNQFRRVDLYSDSDFTSNLPLTKKTLSAKNEENLAKLVLNLLNVLFLWFDLGILDLHPIFILAHDYLLIYLYLHWPVYLLTQITRFLLFCHRWLKKFEKPLFKRLDSRIKISPQPLQA